MDVFKAMTPRQYFDEYGQIHCEKMVRGAGTTIANFKLIALYGGSCSPRLAKSLSEVTDNKMTRDEILFPEIYENEEPA